MGTYHSLHYIKCIKGISSDVALTQSSVIMASQDLPGLILWECV